MEIDVLLLITRSVISSQVHRKPLARIRIPSSALTSCDHPKHVWWVERVGGRLYLRADMFVASGAAAVKTGDHQVWELDTKRSERVSWPGTIGRSIDVSALIEGSIGPLPSGLVLIPIEPQLEEALATWKATVSKYVWNYSQACVFLKRRLTEVSRTIDRPLPFGEAHSLAWDFVRSYCARDELVSISGVDAFDVAASFVAGLESPLSPDTAKRRSASSRTLLPSGFRKLDPQKLHAVCAQSVEKSRGRASFSLDRLASRSRRHQAILGKLAEHVQSAGLQPTYNRHVDMRIDLGDCPVLFEIKTIDKGDITRQVRDAVGQLLEYRFRYKRFTGRSMRLVIVIEHNLPSTDIVEFLGELGISLVAWNESCSAFEGLDAVLYDTANTASALRQEYP